MLKRTVTAALCVAALGMGTLAGCGGDDDVDPGNNNNTSSSSSGGTTDGGASSGGSSSGGSSSGGETTTLYERLGGKTGIRNALGAIVTKELEDPEIASFFGSLSAGPNGTSAEGSPSATQLLECLTNQLGAAAGGPASEVVYPTTVEDPQNGTQTSFTCRDMATSHAKLGIYSSVFDKFVTIAGGVLTEAGVAPADIETIASVLVSTKPQIATSDRTDNGGFDAAAVDPD